MEREPQKPSAIEVIKNYWFIIAFFLGMAVTWGTFITKFSSIESEVNTIKIEAKADQAVLTTLQIDIREIKTSLEFIKEKVR